MQQDEIDGTHSTQWPWGNGAREAVVRAGEAEDRPLGAEAPRV
jgi:hypothetical protein